MNAVLLSTDNGEHWAVPDSGHSPAYLNSIVSDGMTVFAGIGSFSPPESGVFRSADNGSSWTKDVSGLPNAPINAVVISGSNVIAGTAGIFLSSNAGETWLPVTNGIAGSVQKCSNLFVSGSLVFAVTDQGLLRSTNNGTNWLEADSGLSLKPPISEGAFQPLAQSGPNLFACNGSDTIFISTNNGLKWNRLQSHVGFKVNALAANDSVLFAAFGASGSIAYSTNNGLSWTAFGSAHLLYSLIVSGPNLVYGSNSVGINYWAISQILGRSSGVKNSSSNSSSISLGNYPDPITSRTTISFTLPEASAVSLIITDAAGRETPLLHSAWMDAGKHEIVWDASRFPNGVYFCRLEANGKSAMRRIVVRK